MSDEATTEREFLAEVEVMDLSPIKDGTFAVAVATGQPNMVRYLCTTLHGPYNFVEMVQEVGDMWVKQQHHAKVIMLDKSVNSKVKVLDDNTVDYLEAHYVDIIMEAILSSAPADKEYTCVAGVMEDKEEVKVHP